MEQTKKIDYVSHPASSLHGVMQIPGDKSISHRAVILGAIAEGITRIRGFLESADTVSTISVFRTMGVRIEDQDDEIVVHGVGLRGLSPPPGALYFGNSGTSVRLLAGVLAGQPFDSELLGDESLMLRPMRRIVEPLRQMGAAIDCSASGTLPLRIHGGNQLKGISCHLPVASAQLKSCLLLAGLYAQGTTRLVEPAVTRDHTERMLSGFGCNINSRNRVIDLHPGSLQGRRVDVPGDISSAAFFIVAASICPGADITLKNVGVNPTRHAVIEILTLMGADIVVNPSDNTHPEPVADIRVRSHPLNGIAIPAALVPVAIDEFPAILIAAACAQGETILTSAAELRVKESDRIDAMADGLRRLGIQVTTREDGMTVSGGMLQGGEIDSYGDHRIAMAFAIAAVAATAPLRIRNCMNVSTSFPDFVATANAVGMRVDTDEAAG